MKRRTQNSNQSKGIGLVELMISLAVFSVLMVWAYKSMMSTNNVTVSVVRQTQRTQHEMEVRRSLENVIEKIGYNPKLRAYELLAADPSNPDRHRVGVTGMYQDRSEIRFTSDENADGEIQANEQFRLWLAADETSDPVPVDASANGDICAKPAPDSPLPQANKLFALVNSVPVVLAENARCFEIRFFKKGLSGSEKCRKYFPDQPQSGSCASFDPNTGLCTSVTQAGACNQAPDANNWERLWAGATFYSYRAPALPDGTEAGEEAYYGFIRDEVEKIEFGVLLASGNSVERIVVEKKINNRAWQPRLAAACLPGMGALSCGSTSGGIPPTGGGSLPAGGGEPSITPIGTDPVTIPTPTGGGTSPGGTCKTNCTGRSGGGLY